MGGSTQNQDDSAGAKTLMPWEEKGGEKAFKVWRAEYLDLKSM